MTTITVVKKNGYVAIASDTMTKWGSAKESAEHVVNHHKILRVQDSYLAISGQSSADMILKHYFANIEGQPRFGNTEEIFQTWQALHEALKSEYFLRPNDDDSDDFESSRMDVLIANSRGIFSVGAYREVQEFSRFYSHGSGRRYALGAMYSIYGDSDKSAQEIAELGVRAGAEFDDGSGLPVASFSVALAV